MTQPTETSTDPANPGKRAQILEGAWRVFVESGLSGASVDRLAAESGVSKPTLYKYFDSKEAIFLAMLTEQVQRVAGDRFELLPTMGPPEQLLRRLGIGFVSALMQQRSLDTFRLVVSEAPRFPALGAAFEAAGPASGLQMLSRYLSLLDRDGVLRIPDSRLAAQQFMALCECGFLRKAHTLEERPSLREIATVVDSAVSLFLRGYAPADRLGASDRKKPKPSATKAKLNR